jgi:SAM-dependent methyltransferase
MGQTVEQFIEHWQGASGGERSQSQSFLSGLCRVLGVEEPKDGDYKFEYAVTGDRGTDFIDLYKRGCFVLEAKQSRARGGRKAVAGQEDFFEAEAAPLVTGRASRAWDVLMLNARQQAENYARHLPPTHEWPPFIVVCDVGHCFELYADFTGKGRNYTQFPDRQGFRITLDDLKKSAVRELLVKLWTEPHALDPTKRAAKATRDIAERLAAVSRRLEAKNYPPEEVALFLMRCLFTMFAEDTELIPKGAFTALLDRCVADPRAFMPMVSELWKQMNAGGFAVSIGTEVKRFNGHLFADGRVFPMDREEIGELKEAAAKDWKEVDPSIFGTLLEQALDSAERSRLGAHYTPRAYVERLVIATVIEPLREEWNNVVATAERLKAEGDAKGAIAIVKAFHDRLCDTRVLDPACGTGNFLYIALELMKRLEGEVLETLANLGGQEGLAGLERHEVDPHQFLGMEVNPRAAAIAELVLWIGYLRWHLRTRGTAPSEPILREFKNIEKKDAVLAHDGIDAKGNYVNPRRPEWPEADYIVGNPPFIGKRPVHARSARRPLRQSTLASAPRHERVC